MVIGKISSLFLSCGVTKATRARKVTRATLVRPELLVKMVKTV